MAHLSIPGQLIKVRTDELGTPTTFQWDRKWHPVERVYGRWRVDKQWWQQRIVLFWYIVTPTGSVYIVTLR